MKKFALPFSLLAVIVLVGSAQAAALNDPRTKPGDDLNFWKMESKPKISTTTCQNTYGEGSIAGFDKCECIGGYEWNKDKTQCDWTGGRRPLTTRQRILQRIIRTGHYSPSSSSSSASTCTIKGTITTTGEKIYRTLGCNNYRNFVIDPARGEEMFCTEQQAMDAGFRKAFNCL